MNQKTIKNLNNNLDEIIDKSKSFEDQTDYDDKELKSKYLKKD